MTGGTISSESEAHLDPDLRFNSLPRLKGWRPLFGQAGSAQGHLKNQGITKGDIFVFYGWFRKAKCVGGKYQYIKNAPDLHVIFGWLQVEKIIPVSRKEIAPQWALYHPHFNRPQNYSNDSVYVATKELKIPGYNLNLPGAGCFDYYDPILTLTAPGQRKKTVLKEDLKNEKIFYTSAVNFLLQTGKRK